MFRNFLRGEYSEENILFWLACEDFNKHTDKAYIERRSKLIYMNYIHPDSSTEVKIAISNLNKAVCIFHYGGLVCQFIRCQVNFDMIRLAFSRG